MRITMANNIQNRGDEREETIKYARCMLRQQLGREPDEMTLSRVVDQLLANRPRKITLDDLQERERMCAAIG